MTGAGRQAAALEIGDDHGTKPRRERDASIIRVALNFPRVRTLQRSAIDYVVRCRRLFSASRQYGEERECSAG